MTLYRVSVDIPLKFEIEMEARDEVSAIYKAVDEFLAGHPGIREYMVEDAEVAEVRQ